MSRVAILPQTSLGKDFIQPEYLKESQHEYEIRDIQSFLPSEKWRNLNADEIEVLVRNHNRSDNWDNIKVTEVFDASLIRNNRFYGLVRIGSVSNNVLKHHDLKLSVGITNSMIVSCDIGNDVAIHNVQYLSHYIIGNRCILFNIDEMNTTDHAKFGNGILKNGESEDVRVWLDLMNENGLRRVIPFDGMLPADAYIWAKYRDDTLLMDRFKEITQSAFDSRRGYYGTVGDECVIKNSKTLKDLKIGPSCYIKGANKVKNITINSSNAEPTQIGEGVELVNGIIGFGCRIFYGCKAVRFILGNNSNLKYGARLINSFLGDNSTISCCEVLNNLIFPAHEQHHNNSFLVASVVMGQSNIAAGVTIGSNHNSRANEGEIVAGRGFWPGLCTSLKHHSRFVSYTLIAKSDYPAELNIYLPFALVNNNVSQNRIEVMPAYWWLYNMYALVRNSRKFLQRDIRKSKLQNIEFEALAPDSVEEIFSALTFIEKWTGEASIRKKGLAVKGMTDAELIAAGKNLLAGEEENVAGLEIIGENMEKSNRKCVLLKPYKGYHAYRNMILYYSIKTIADFFKLNNTFTIHDLNSYIKCNRVKSWVNIGGQLMPESTLDKIRSDIREGILNTWPDIHNRYDEVWEDYQQDKLVHACNSVANLFEIKKFNDQNWSVILENAVTVQKYISDQVYLSRKKDYENGFTSVIFRNEAEKSAAMGDIDKNDFIISVKAETKEYIELFDKLKKLSS